MKTSKIKLPAKHTQTLYHFKRPKVNGFFLDLATSTEGDTTTTCTTVITTTH